MPNRCEFCNQATEVLRRGDGWEVLVNTPGAVRWVGSVIEIQPGILMSPMRQTHYQEHVETCSAKKLLQKKLDAAEAEWQENARAAQATAEEKVEAGE